MSYIPYMRPLNKQNFRKIDSSYPHTFHTLQAAIDWTTARIPPNCSSVVFEIRHNGKTVWSKQPTSDRRAIEMPVGTNLGVLELRVDKCHVSEPLFSVIRKCLGKIRKDRSVPRPLLRGAIVAIINKHRENRKLYSDVMSGRA